MNSKHSAWTFLFKKKNLNVTITYEFLFPKSPAVLSIQVFHLDRTQMKVTRTAARCCQLWGHWATPASSAQPTLSMTHALVKRSLYTWSERRLNSTGSGGLHSTLMYAQMGSSVININKAGSRKWESRRHTQLTILTSERTSEISIGKRNTKQTKWKQNPLSKDRKPWSQKLFFSFCSATCTELQWRWGSHWS